MDLFFAPEYQVNPKDPAEAGKIRVWTGSAWAYKPVKYWDGTAWVQKPIKRWTGVSWEN